MAVGPQFCTRCGGRLVERLLLDHERAVCPRCGEVHYQNLKVAAAAIVRVAGDEIVLVRRSIEPGYGLLGLPGGHVELGETVEAGAIRETREEVGLDVALDSLLTVVSHPGGSLAVVVYLAHPTGGKLLRESPECQEVFTVRRSRIPWRELPPSASRTALQCYTGLTEPPGVVRSPG